MIADASIFKYNVTEHSKKALEKDRRIVLSSLSVDLLRPIVYNLMNQYSKYAKDFKEYLIENIDYRKEYIRYINYQLNHFDAVRHHFKEYFNAKTYKTKEDLYLYLVAYNLPLFYFNEHLYKAMYKFLERGFNSGQWVSSPMDSYDAFKPHTQTYQYFNDKKIDTVGFHNISINIDEVVDIMREVTNIEDRDINNIDIRLQSLMALLPVMENYEGENRPFYSEMKHLIKATQKYSEQVLQRTVIASTREQKAKVLIKDIVN